MASPFATDHTTDVPMPTDPPHVVTIRKLTGREFEQGQAAHLAAFVGGQPARGWNTRFLDTLKRGVATDREAARALKDPIAGFDRATVVKAGVLRWDYPDRTLPAAIDELDDDALEYLAIEIMRLTKPAWFQTPGEREDAEKELAAAAPGA